jgi:hypothetical protein
MRNLLLILIAFIAVVTFIRAFEEPVYSAGASSELIPVQQMVETNAEN